MELPAKNVAFSAWLAAIMCHPISPCTSSYFDLPRPATPGQDRLRKFPIPGSDVPGFLGGVPVGGWLQVELNHA